MNINDRITTDEFVTISCALRNRQSVMETLISSSWPHRNNTDLFGDTMRNNIRDSIAQHRLCKRMLQDMGAVSR